MPARFEGVSNPTAMDSSNGNGDCSSRNKSSSSSDDDIVISGFSGRLPESSSIDEFKRNLFEGVDMVTDDERRWPNGLHGLPSRTGKIKDLSSFDAVFFGVHAKQATVMDPQLRILLELTHEAIIDAGINPNDIRGTNTGVFIGVSDSESDEFWTADPDMVNGYGLTGCCRAMFPNRISYTFDFKGPSFALDTACSSSLYAMHQAILSMRNGECDAAIVGGVNLVLKPTSSLQFHRLSMLSPDGSCKAFDASGNGYVRSEAAVVIYLQKTRDARRIYATVVNSKTNVDGNKSEGITFPSGAMQNKLMRQVYDEAGVDPCDVCYVEAHGTGTKVGDPQEVNSIADLFCQKKRKTPLLIGSIKSNMGHSEPASGLCSIAKMLIAMEAGVIPANLHFNKPNPDIPALNDGRIIVVDKARPWNGGLIAINSFGFGGANAHVILRSNPKPKLLPSINNDIPKIVAVSGRTNDSINMFLDKIQEYEKDDEFISLVHKLHNNNIVGHNYRGFQILGTNKYREIDEYRPPVQTATSTSDKRPIWYVFSGMGSQWAGMGRQLMPIKQFEKSLKLCAAALEPLGIDLMDLILNGTNSSFESVLNSFVSIAAIQVAIVDVLTMIGIKPDGIVGHSVGELGCAYADDTFTPEQTVLAAYWRGKSIQEANLPPGAMAAVGLTWQQAIDRCPKDISPACHNSNDSVTVSGPVDSINKFVDELKKEEIFAKVVNSSGVAFHSKYISSAGPKLRDVLDKLIKNPKQRSSKWISSSIPESSWSTPLAKLSSPAYHVNNLLSPVLFQEAIKHIPDNAIVIEIAPHCLLQAILKRSLPKTCTNIGLHKRDHANNLEFLLMNLGKLYNAGGQPDFTKLYQTINYPVGRGTPMINSMIGWDHSIEWAVADFSGKSGGSGETIIEIDLSKDEHSYISGHTIDGRILFPATGYLTLVWKTFAKLHNTDYEKLPITFENVQFHRATIMPKEGPVRFLINIFDGTGDFEICEGGSPAVTGKIFKSDDPTKDQLNNLPIPSANNTNDVDGELLNLNKTDIYKDLRLRGYDYGGIFQGIKTSNNHGNTGELVWNNDWISFMDTMLQYSILGGNSRDLYLPVRIQYAAINPIGHYEMLKNNEIEIENANDVAEVDAKPSEKTLNVYSYKNINLVKCGGVEIRGMKASLASRRQQTQSSPKHEKYVFIPYENNQILVEDPTKSRLHALTVMLQTVIENLNVLKIKGVEDAGERSAESLLSPIIMDILLSEPGMSADVQVATTTPETYSTFLDQWNVKIVSGGKDASKTTIGQDLHIVIGADVLSNGNKTALTNLEASIKHGGFIILEETGNIQKSLLHKTELVIVGMQICTGKTYVLIKKIQEKIEPIIIQISEKNFSWLEGVKSALKKSAEDENIKILLVSQGEELLGIVGLMTCIRRENGGNNTQYIFIQDKNAPKFTLTNEFYSKQIDKQLMANVLKGNQWGSYRHLRLDQQTDASSLQVEHAYINALTRGDLSSLRWIEGPLSYYHPEKYPQSELCSVYYAPLNFRDIMLATGKLSPDALPGDLAGQDCILGLEFSGRNSIGKRVMGIVAARGLATTLLADPKFMWQIPDKWSMEDAATIPVCYSTSYYALVVRGKMRKGETVLIHAGTGGVGQASISIALHAGCKVFTTVGSTEKRELLKKLYPQLTDDNIGNSRDTSFEQLILNQTQGRGVDIVLNSLAGNMLQASIRCLANNGRFLEIGKFDLSNNTALGMSVFLKNTSFHGILLDALFDNDCPEKTEIVRLVDEGIKTGAVKPLPLTVFTEQQIEHGFRYMASGKHMGKILLKIRDEETTTSTSRFVDTIKPALKTVAAIPRTYMNPDKSYVLVGGLGGFGLELAHWMITRGAKYIVLTSRSGVRNGYQSLCIRRWREMGINIVVSKCDATTIDGAEKLINISNKLAPIGGIFNLAAVLRDNLIENLNEADFKISSLPKIDATKNLDILSRKYCPSLDYFVVFSSVSCGRGNQGQTNYGLSNSAMERIVEQRQSMGLPGLAIQWGAIGDVGLIVDTMGGNSDTEVGGTLPQRMNSCLATMDVFLQQPHPVLASMVLADINKSNDNTGNQVSLLDAVGNILGIKDVKTVNPANSLADLGMDSLMGTEIKQTLERNYDLVLSAQEIRVLTFEKLAALSGGGASGEAADNKDNTNDNTTTNNNNTNNDDKTIPTTPTSPDHSVDNSLLFQCTGNEILPKNSIIRLESKSNTGEPVFFVSAIEGMVSSLVNIALELKRPVYGLQCIKGAPLDSLNDLAEFYIKEIKKIQKKGPYTLMGYSFGACVAFEMGLQLENNNEKVILNLLDGSPDFVVLHTKSIGKQTGKNVHADGCRKALSFFVRQINSSVNFINVYTTLRDIENHDDMLNKMVELIGTTSFNSEDLKIAGMLFYKKIFSSVAYKPSGKYKGPVTLLKATDTFMSFNKDYGLGEHCEQDVRIEELLGNHRTITAGGNAKQIAEIFFA